MRKSLSCDRGQEMACHEPLRHGHEGAYFGEPRSPWPRGGKENASGLLHQRFPRGTDLSVYTQEQLDAVADEINARSRKALGGRTPLCMPGACSS